MAQTKAKAPILGPNDYRKGKARWAWSDKVLNGGYDLSKAALKLAWKLDTTAGNKWLCWKSQDTMAAEMGVSTRTIERGKRELEALGLISVTVRNKTGLDSLKPNVYRLIIPPGRPVKLPKGPTVLVDKGRQFLSEGADSMCRLNKTVNKTYNKTARKVVKGKGKGVGIDTSLNQAEPSGDANAQPIPTGPDGFPVPPNTKGSGLGTIIASLNLGVKP